MSTSRAGRFPPRRWAGIPGRAVVFGVRLALAALALAGTYSIWALLRLEQLAFFTNLAAVGFLVVLLWSLVSDARARSGPPPAFVLVVVVAEVLAGVVAALLLEPSVEGALIVGLTYGQIMHMVLPVGAVVDFLLFRPHRRLRPEQAVLAALVPWLYLVLVVVLAAAVGFVPYPFLDVTSLGLMRVAGNVVLCLGIAGGTAVVLLVADRTLGVRALVGGGGDPRPTR